MIRWSGLVCLLWLGCGSDAPVVDDCADSLAGVWQGQEVSASGEPMRLHILDHGGSLEIYTMFDDSYPPSAAPGAAYDKRASDIAYSPAVIDIQRRGPALIGNRTYRATRGAVTCTIRHQAAIRSCADNQLELAWVPTARLDWATCKVIEGSAWQVMRVRRVRQ